MYNVSLKIECTCNPGITYYIDLWHYQHNVIIFTHVHYVHACTLPLRSLIVAGLPSSVHHVCIDTGIEHAIVKWSATHIHVHVSNKEHWNMGYMYMYMYVHVHCTSTCICISICQMTTHLLQILDVSITWDLISMFMGVEQVTLYINRDTDTQCSKL